MKGKRSIDRSLSSVLGAIFLIMMLSTLLQICVRFTSVSLSWTEELARVGFVFVTFIGLGIAFREREHIVVSSFIDRLKPKTKAKVQLFVNFSLILFMFILMRSSFVMIRRTWDSPTGALSEFGVTIGHKYLVIPIGLIIFFLYVIGDIKNILMFLREEEN